MAPKYIFVNFTMNEGARGSVVGSGTMIQVRRSRDRIPMRSLISFSIYLILWHYGPMALGSTQPLTEMSTAGIFLEVKGGRPARRADNLTAIYDPTVYKM
jgi:hypothetical protein